MAKKSTPKTTQKVPGAAKRPPVVAIMGHIDHGKSTLLDAIRKSNIVAREAGGITQHLGAYEVIHANADGSKRRITFLDTPGHAAFGGIRERSARAADVAILIISGEEGVKPQTIEALSQIRAAGVPFIVAITKMDSPKANVERTKQSLAEHEIYVDGYGGDISTVPISAKTGEGLPELLELVLLTADMAELTGNPDAPAEGIVIEAHRDARRGNAATIIIKNGTLKPGVWMAAAHSTVPVRFIENDLLVQVPSATFSSPVQVVGWSDLPEVGSIACAYVDRNDAQHAAQGPAPKPTWATVTGADDGKLSIPVVIKADAGGSVEAIVGELTKLTHERAKITVIEASVGDVTEKDLKIATTRPGSLVLCFNVKINKSLSEMAERNAIPVQFYDIIYKLTEDVEKILLQRAPKVSVEETSGKAKILKVFSVSRDKQIVGGRVESGTILVGATVRILRRDVEIGRGKIRGLEQSKAKATEVGAGREFGTMIEAKIEIAAGDSIETFTTSEQ